MKSLAVIMSGFIFALGLGLSGMTKPSKVIGFLDFFGTWDPSLMFVMVGAIFVHGITYRLITKRQTPLFDSKWSVPSRKDITPSLIFGSAVFGIGWGLSGFCPGPALVSLADFGGPALSVVCGMVAGMILFNLINKKVNFKR